MRYLIDGNNLTHIYGQVIGPAIGRYQLCRLLSEWAARTAGQVLIVFDGPRPLSGVEQQMRLAGLDIRFSEGRSADDVIQDLIEQADSPANVCVVSSDRAIATAARHRRCRTLSSQEFSEMMAHDPAPRPAAGPPTPDKPPAPGPSETDGWLREFGIDPAAPDAKRPR